MWESREESNIDVLHFCVAESWPELMEWHSLLWKLQGTSVLHEAESHDGKNTRFGVYWVWLLVPALPLPDYVVLIESLIQGSVSASVKCDNAYSTSSLKDIKFGAHATLQSIMLIRSLLWWKTSFKVFSNEPRNTLPRNTRTAVIQYYKGQPATPTILWIHGRTTSKGKGFSHNHHWRTGRDDDNWVEMQTLLWALLYLCVFAKVISDAGDGKVLYQVCCKARKCVSDSWAGCTYPSQGHVLPKWRGATFFFLRQKRLPW